MALLDDLESAYLDAAAGGARVALRRALADALAEIEAVSGRVSRGYVRGALTPADRNAGQSVLRPLALDSQNLACENRKLRAQDSGRVGVGN